MKASGIFLSVNTEVGESVGTRDRFCGLTEFSETTDPELLDLSGQEVVESF
jgi:hypothetical protein